jgi:hypothetical protein
MGFLYPHSRLFAEISNGKEGALARGVCTFDPMLANLEVKPRITRPFPVHTCPLEFLFSIRIPGLAAPQLFPATPPAPRFAPNLHIQSP